MVAGFPGPPGLSSITRVASEETNSRSCDTKSSVPGYFSSAVLSDSIDSMSRWLVGSSSSMTLGICSTRRPISMRCASPPEMTFTDFLCSSPEKRSWPSVARTMRPSSPRSGLRQRAAERAARPGGRGQPPGMSRRQPRPQQCRPAHALRPDDGDLLALLHDEVEALDARRGRGAGRQALGLDDDAVELLLVVDEKADEGVLAARGLHVLDLQLLDLLHARGGLAGLGLVRAEAAHELLEVGDALLGARVGVQLLLARERGGLHVVVVVA